MSIRIVEFVNIVLSALVGGMYWGPWLALSRSLKNFDPGTFLAIVQRLNQNMSSLMTVLTPIALLSTMPTLLLSFDHQPTTFYATLIGFVFFTIALFVTVLIEVPLVKQMKTWTVPDLPENWIDLRDRWGRFHIIRVVTGLAGFIFLLAGALF